MNAGAVRESDEGSLVEGRPGPQADAEAVAPRPLPPDRREPWRSFLRSMFWVGINSFGGPVAQIGVMQSEAVDKRKWLSHGQFVHLINFANVIPGPEALEISIHLGWLRRGMLGGIAAGLLFIWPGFVSLTALAWLYRTYGRDDAVMGFFGGIRPVALALVAAAAMRLSSKSLGGGVSYVLMGAAFVANHLFGVHFAVILVGSGLLGLLIGKERAPARVPKRMGWIFVAIVAVLIGGAEMISTTRAHDDPVDRAAVRAERVTAPVGTFDRLVEIAAVNTKAALFTFGGAYTVLPYLREQAVERRGWVSDHEMMDALGLGETTPGPLISIGVFLSYLAGGFPGAVVGCFFLFLPSFVFVLGLGRFIEHVERIPHARSVLRGFSAGTLGLIIALAAGLVRESITDWFAAAVAILSFVAVVRLRASMLLLVLAGGCVGLLRTWAAFG